MVARRCDHRMRQIGAVQSARSNEGLLVKGDIHWYDLRRKSFAGTPGHLFAEAQSGFVDSETSVAVA